MTTPAESPSSPEIRPARRVLGTALECTSYADFTARAQAMARTGRTVAVDFTNTQIVTMRRHELAFREITSRFDYFVPDSTPLIWCLNLRQPRIAARTYGPTFMRHCVIHSPAPITHYFLGGSDECLAKLQTKFRALNQHVQIIGARNGYFKPSEEAATLDEINRLSPDFIWVGLGTPKQQDWIHRNKSTIQRGVIFAVGFAFDVNAGTKPDAPDWMQRCGLTWFYRLCSEPRRLLPRYLKYNSLFIGYLLWDVIRGRAWR